MTEPRLTADDVASGFERPFSEIQTAPQVLGPNDPHQRVPLCAPDPAPADSPEARLRAWLEWTMQGQHGPGPYDPLRYMQEPTFTADIAAVLDRLEAAEKALTEEKEVVAGMHEGIRLATANLATLRAERDAAVEALKPSRQAILLKGVASERDEAQAEVKRLEADLAAARATVEAQRHIASAIVRAHKAPPLTRDE